MRFHVLASAALLLTALAAPAPGAQSSNEQWAVCAGSDLATAITACTVLIQSGGHNDQDRALAYNNRGNAYRQHGDYARAIRDYDQALQLDSQLELAYNGRGATYAASGDAQRAINDYSAAI